MPRLVSNPPNPWASQHVEWLEEPPEATLEVYEEEAVSVVTENDSPDVGFRFSVNPYRGCQHSCAYCLAGDMRILMGDGATKAIADVLPGDVVYGTVRRGTYRRFVRTPVLARWPTLRAAYRVTLADGTVIVSSGDHRFLSDRGWKHVTPCPRGKGQRPFLTPRNRLLGTGAFAQSRADTPDYRTGYLCGMVRGDGHLGRYSYSRSYRATDVQYRFRLALADPSALLRARRYLQDRGIETREFLFQAAVGTRREMRAIRTQKRDCVESIRAYVAWPSSPSSDWRRGFLAGIFDAEGSYSEGVLRIANTDLSIIRHTVDCLAHFSLPCVVEPGRGPNPVSNVRVRGGLRQHLRFFHIVDPAITRKREIVGRALKCPARLGVVSVEPLGLVLPMHDMTTGTGDFIAEGVVSHNCYARPSHQYLGFGAGTDFERRIVVKVNAAEVLRRTLRRPSWRGDEIAFSGNTDCYQPLEASYGLTRRCLEACLEVRNPVVAITKGVLVRRDADVLAALAREARVRVHVSVAFASDRVAKAIDVGAASPVRRFEAMRALSDAGVPVGLALAPVIPGLNDADVPELLERARDAGATTAFMTMLRLPAEVRPVFSERLRAAFPDRAEKVFSQVRDARGGNLNESAFGRRMTGKGPRWRAVSDLFRIHARRLGLSTDEAPAGPEPTTYRRRSAQGTLFYPD